MDNWNWKTQGSRIRTPGQLDNWKTEQLELKQCQSTKSRNTKLILKGVKRRKPKPKAKPKPKYQNGTHRLNQKHQFQNAYLITN